MFYNMFYNSKITLITIILLTLLLFLTFLDLYIGSIEISFSEIVEILTYQNTQDSQKNIVIFQIRLPRVLAAIVSGAALAVSGLLMQTVFRNPLAGPDVLGVTAGAGLGVALFILGIGHFSNFLFVEKISAWSLILSATAGAAAVLILIYLVTIRLKDIMSILIIGILIGSGVVAIVNVLQYFSNAELLKSYVIWTMGSLSGLSAEQMPIYSLIVLIFVIAAFFISKRLNILLLGEQYARISGVNLVISRLLIFSITCVLSASVTAFCGPIAFVGVAVPHITKILVKTTNHFILIPFNLFLGAIVMLTSDIISNTLISGKIIPINSITAIIGIPVVIWIVIRNYNFYK